MPPEGPPPWDPRQLELFEGLRRRQVCKFCCAQLPLHLGAGRPPEICGAKACKLARKRCYDESLRELRRSVGLTGAGKARVRPIGVKSRRYKGRP